MLDKKFIESFEVSDWEVETETGWEEITHSNKTISFEVWEIKTDSFSLECADDHIVIGKNNQQIFTKDLKIGQKIQTKNGLEKVRSIKNLGFSENMYDLSVNSKNHTYYTSGILSHNTTISSIYIAHYAIFNEDKTIAVLANKEKTALEIMGRIKMIYENLPLWLQSGIADGGWNKQSITLGNGTRIIAASTASSAIRGFSINCLFLDEFGFVPNNVAEQFMNSVYPTISSGKTSKIIIVSTPNGMNHYYNIWVDAVKGKSTFFPIKINWWEHPERDENFKRNMIRDRGLIYWNQEFAGKFIGSTNTLIDSEVLERIENIDPITTKWNGIFQIYEEPQPNSLYILGIDSAEGIGKDYSVVQVLKINSEIDLEQVAVFRNNVIDYNKFAQICVSISQYYNDAYMMIENNGVGAMVASTIWNDYECDKIINCDPKGLGIKSTKKTKLEGNLLMKRYMESYWLKICDKQTIYELSLYEEIKPDVYASPDHAHDDCVTSLIWALYFISTEFFDAKNLETKKIEEKFRLANEMNEKPVIFTSDEEDYEDEESDFWLFS